MLSPAHVSALVRIDFFPELSVNHPPLLKLSEGLSFNALRVLEGARESDIDTYFEIEKVG